MRRRFKKYTPISQEITPEEWALVLSLTMSHPSQRFLEALRDSGNKPVNCRYPHYTRLETINNMLSQANLPFRLMSDINSTKADRHWIRNLWRVKINHQNM